MDGGKEGGMNGWMDDGWNFATNEFTNNLVFRFSIYYLVTV